MLYSNFLSLSPPPLPPQTVEPDENSNSNNSDPHSEGEGEGEEGEEGKGEDGEETPRHRSNSCPPKSSLDVLPPFPGEGGEKERERERERKSTVGKGGKRVIGGGRWRLSPEEEELNELLVQFQGKKKEGGGGGGEGGREKGYVFVCAGVGDCKAYVYLHKEKRVVDFTAKSR